MGLGLAELREPKTCGDDLACPICLGALEAAVRAPCEHTFCRLCAERALQWDPRCPMCRQSLAPQDLKPACNLLQMRVNGLVVCCERRCGWYGRRDARSAHAKVCEIGRQTEFAVALQGPLGIMWASTEEHLFVDALSGAGAAVEHNRRMEGCGANQIRPGCVIVEINGLRGDCCELAFAMGQGGPLRLVFRHATKFCTTMVKISGSFGLELFVPGEGHLCLEVRQVLRESSVGDDDQHSSSAADEKLRSKDRIVEVNGVRGRGRDLLRRLENSEKCAVRVLRLL